jgi:hypothetical protein
MMRGAGVFIMMRRAAGFLHVQGQKIFCCGTKRRGLYRREIFRPDPPVIAQLRRAASCSARRRGTDLINEAKSPALPCR